MGISCGRLRGDGLLGWHGRDGTGSRPVTGQARGEAQKPPSRCRIQGVWRGRGVVYTIGALPRPEAATGWTSLGDTTVTEQEIESKVIKIVAEQLGADQGKITRATSFKTPRVR